MKRNKITRLLSVFLLVVTLSIACLCGCEEKELICKFKDFEGEYSFLDFKDENVWLNRSILGVYWSFYEKVQYDNQKSGWKKIQNIAQSNYSISVRTEYLNLRPQAGKASYSSKNK